MMTLFIDPAFPLKMRPQTPTKVARLGAGGLQARRGNTQPFYEFEITLRLRDQEAADELSGFLAYHQKDTAMKFDGGPYGDIKQPIFIGYGNGTQTQFFLPRRNVLASSWVLKVNGVNSAATIDEAAGLATFGAAPPLNSLVTGYGRNWFKVIVKPDQGTDLFSIGDMPFNIFDMESLILEEVA